MKIIKHTFKKEKFSEDCALYISKLINDLIKSKNFITIALSGGSTPLPILNQLVSFDIDWSKIKFFMVDERDVSLDSNESNYKNLNECFLTKIGASIYPMKNAITVEQSVDNYTKYLKKTFINKKPLFDIILLGMGTDGHIASLFPDSNVLKEKTKWVTYTYIEKLESNRITITYPIIENSKNIILIAKGREKKQILENNKTNNLPIHELLKKSTVNWLYSD